MLTLSSQDSLADKAVRPLRDRRLFDCINPARQSFLALSVESPYILFTSTFHNDWKNEMNSHGPQDDTKSDLPRSDLLSTAASAASIATAVYTLGKDIPNLFSSNKKIILQVIDSRFETANAGTREDCHVLKLRLTSNCIHTLLLEGIQLTAKQGPISARKIELMRVNRIVQDIRMLRETKLPQQMEPEEKIEIQVTFIGLVPDPKDRSLLLTYSSLAQHKSEKLETEIKLMWD